MRVDRFTQKMQEALQAAQDLAGKMQQQEVANDHFLLALLEQSEGITRPLLEKVGVDIRSLRERLQSDLDRRPKITGSTFDQRLGN